MRHPELGHVSDSVVMVGRRCLICVGSCGAFPLVRGVDEVLLEALDPLTQEDHMKHF